MSTKPFFSAKLRRLFNGSAPPATIIGLNFDLPILRPAVRELLCGHLGVSVKIPIPARLNPHQRDISLQAPKVTRSEQGI